MKLSAILVLLGATNAIQLTDVKATVHPEWRHEGLSALLHLPATTEYPNYPAGSIEQLDDGVCRQSGCGQDKEAPVVTAPDGHKVVVPKPEVPTSEAKPHKEKTCQEMFEEATRIENKWKKATDMKVDIMKWCDTDAECKVWMANHSLQKIEQCMREHKIKF